MIQNMLTYGQRQAKRYLRPYGKCTDSDSSNVYAKSHPGIYSPLIQSIVSNDSDSEGPN